MDPIVHPKKIFTGVLTFVVALSWNESAKTAIEYLFPIEIPDERKKAAILTLSYAIFVTLIIILIVYMFNKYENEIDSFILPKSRVVV